MTLCGVSGATLGEEAKYFTLRISVITSPAFWHILVPLQLRSLNKSIAFRTNSYSARCCLTGRRTAFNGSTNATPTIKSQRTIPWLITRILEPISKSLEEDDQASELHEAEEVLRMLEHDPEK